jgi:hypothetical protein
MTKQQNTYAFWQYHHPLGEITIFLANFPLPSKRLNEWQGAKLHIPAAPPGPLQEKRAAFLTGIAIFALLGEGPKNFLTPMREDSGRRVRMGQNHFAWPSDNGGYSLTL